MPSGPTRIIYNTRERLLSTDANRAQSFAAQAQQQAWRARHNDLRSNWRYYPGLSTQAQVVNAPVYGEVYGGLFVRPDAPSYLTIDPGVAMLLAVPTPALDNSPYLFADDPGVSTPGVLPFTANANPGTLRWDVVECQAVDTVLEVQNRDEYNPATGLFTPISMDKVAATRLTYRIRLGTPGAGFPGGAAGWMPLAVAAVRDGATGFNQVDFYDVRPLVEERVMPQPLGVVGDEGLSLPSKGHYYSFQGSYFGYSETEFGGYHAGGALRTTVPAISLARFGTDSFTDSGDANGVRLGNACNLGTHVIGDSDMAYLAALFPVPPPGQHFIPRWARYSEAPVPALGRRVPNGTRGILVITTTQPGPNNIFAPLPFPAASQLGVNGVGPVLAMASTFNAATYGYGVSRDGLYEHSDLANIAAPAWMFPASSVALNLAAWDLVAGVHYPPGCKSLRVSFEMSISAAFHVPSFIVRSTANGFAHTSLSFVSGLGIDPSPVAAGYVRSNVITVMRVPLSTPYPLINTTDWTIRVGPSLDFSPTTFVGAHMRVHGWEF